MRPTRHPRMEHQTALVALYLLVGCNGDSPRNRQNLIEAACEGRHTRVASLLRGGVNANAVDSHGRSPLSCAAESCSLEATQLLIRYGADTRTVTSRAFPLASIAWFAMGRYEWCSDGPAIVDVLLENGADVNAVLQNDTGYCHTALDRARSAEAFAYIAKRGGDLHACEGRAPVLHAVYDTIPVLKKFLELGGNPNGRDDAGQTALHLAARRKAADHILLPPMRILLTHKADPNILDHAGNTPLDYALEKDFREAVELLEKHGGKRGTALPRTQAMFAKQAERERRIIDGAFFSRNTCSIRLIGGDFNTSGSDAHWAMIQGTTATLSTNCEDSGFVNLVVRANKPGDKPTMVLNMPVSAGPGRSQMLFGEAWVNASVLWFFSKSAMSEESLASAIESRRAWITARHQITVAPLNGRTVKNGRLTADDDAHGRTTPDHAGTGPRGRSARKPTPRRPRPRARFVVVRRRRPRRKRRTLDVGGRVQLDCDA